MPSFSILSWLIWLPICGGLLVSFLLSRNEHLARWSTLIISILTFGISLFLLFHFDRTTHEMQFVENRPWIETFNIRYALGIDGISLLLILLTTLMTVLVVVAGWDTIKQKISQYYAAFLVLEGLMLGVFCALDSALFYVFFEGTLIPMFIIIGVWGGERRVYATLKFFLYTFLGSVFMLLAFIYMYNKGGSFQIADLYDLKLSHREQIFIFLALLTAFAVKVPMWPVHTWLPDAHVEAPTGGSVILAAIMLKIGAYGLLRFSLPITPDACRSLMWMIIVLSLIAIVYVGLVALAQKDLKKLIAYSSIAHMGFVTLGFFLIFHLYMGDEDFAHMGVAGGLVQMISHGFISGALFLCVGVLYDRIHSRQISDYGGVANTMPIFAAFFVLFAMANVGLPGTSGFVGEFMVILASFNANFWFAVLAATTLIIGATYTLWMVKRVVFGQITNDRIASLKDLNRKEFFNLSVLSILMIAVGIWPNPLIELADQSITYLLGRAQATKFL